MNVVGVVGAADTEDKAVGADGQHRTVGRGGRRKCLLVRLSSDVVDPASVSESGRRVNRDLDI